MGTQRPHLVCDAAIKERGTRNDVLDSAQIKQVQQGRVLGQRRHDWRHQVQPVDAMDLHALEHLLHVELGQQHHRVAAVEHHAGHDEGEGMAERQKAQHPVELLARGLAILERARLQNVVDDVVVRHLDELLEPRGPARGEVEGCCLGRRESARWQLGSLPAYLEELR